MNRCKHDMIRATCADCQQADALKDQGEATDEEEEDGWGKSTS